MGENKTNNETTNAKIEVLKGKLNRKNVREAVDRLISADLTNDDLDLEGISYQAIEFDELTREELNAVCDVLTDCRIVARDNDAETIGSIIDDFYDRIKSLDGTRSVKKVISCMDEIMNHFDLDGHDLDSAICATIRCAFSMILGGKKPEQEEPVTATAAASTTVVEDVNKDDKKKVEKIEAAEVAIVTNQEKEEVKELAKKAAQESNEDFKIDDKMKDILKFFINHMKSQCSSTIPETWSATIPNQEWLDSVFAAIDRISKECKDAKVEKTFQYITKEFIAKMEDEKYIPSALNKALENLSIREIVEISSDKDVDDKTNSINVIDTLIKVVELMVELFEPENYFRPVKTIMSRAMSV